MVRPLGLHWRSKFLRQLGVEITRRRHVPRELHELMSLPGVGPYAASAYLSFHARSRGVLLDSNIVRFYGRLLGVPTGPETRRTRLFREIAEYVTPGEGSRAFNYAMLDFTRTICTPRPRCPECPLLATCSFGRAAAAAERRKGKLRLLDSRNGLRADFVSQHTLVADRPLD